jgi:hypothetical protein
MPALTPQFLFDFESNMQTIQEDEYYRLTQDLWYPKITRIRPSSSKRERIAWLLSTAMIRSQGKGGNIQFDDLVALSTEYVNLNSGAGFKLTRDKLEDNDGEGFDLATKWSGDIGAYMAYWPQKQVAKAMLNGEVGIGYDGVSFFNQNHLVNPLDPSSPKYANIFTGGASGSYPGALPIDNSVSLDVALANVQKALAYVRAIKMPNGEDPRKLKAVGMIGPPALQARMQQLTNARFIAQQAAGGAGSGDISSIITNWGMMQPTIADEFTANTTYTLDDGSTVSGSDTSWYLVCSELSSSKLGAMVYVDRESYKINYHDGVSQSDLDRKRELEWEAQGRNVTGYGHPFLLFKVKAT